MAQTSFFSQNFIGWPPVSIRMYADPQSRYWFELAAGEKSRLVKLIGLEAANQWIDENIDENATWQRIHELLQRRVNQVVEGGPGVQSSCPHDTKEGDALHE